MPTKDPRIDAYIAKSEAFAKPILEHIRSIVHDACPDCVETMKWSMPHFDYNGSMICSMASFKAHCAFGFWKASLIFDKFEKSTEAMGQFGRIASIKDLPSKREITSYIKKAMKLNDEGVTVARPSKKSESSSAIHPDFEKALKKNKSARDHFHRFSPGKLKEYTEWVADAKTDATRTRRIEQAIEWISEGKSRNWKYER